jgi:hypothetical protein
MACFAVTTVAAVGVAVARHIVKHNEKKAEKNEVVSVNADTLKTSKKLGILEIALFGGSFILAGEHVLHGEVTFTFPFLTSITEGSDAIKTMLAEMGTVGVGMTALIFVAWGIGLVIRKYLLNRKKKAEVK